MELSRKKILKYLNSSYKARVQHCITKMVSGPASNITTLAILAR